MKHAAPGKILVVLVPVDPHQWFGESLETPWACEVSALPRKGDTITTFDASALRHPARHVWTRRDPPTRTGRKVGEGYGEARDRWGFAAARARWVVLREAVYLQDLDVFVLPVDHDTTASAKVPDGLHLVVWAVRAAAQALDLEEPPERYTSVTMGDTEERKQP